MKKLVASISDELDQELRVIINGRYGGKRGAISIVVEEALKAHLKALKDR